MTHINEWWHKSVFYQIYPRSFNDSNGDGIGDIEGIIQKLDYLEWLGVDAIWLSPHYPSPQIDVGYDVADYTGVNPEYGTMDDFKRMLDLMHERGMKLIIDVVMNHTSDEHGWFKESRSSKDNPKRDWYIWRDGAGDGLPPNNWESTFGGSAWEYDEATGQYYYHYFLKEQPDLNWRNPEVQKAVFDSLRFWFDMGVDGLRLDAIGTIFENIDLIPHESEHNAYHVLRGYWMGKQMGYTREQLLAIEGTLFTHQRDLPEIHHLMRELRDLTNEYEGRFLIGETRNTEFLGNGTNELHAVFNFDLNNMNTITAPLLRDNQDYWLNTVPHGAWFSNTVNNHDQSRAKTHYGDGIHNHEQAPLWGALVLTLPGIPFLYYGEEIGMEDYAVKSYDEVRDMVSMVYRDIMRQEGKTDAQIVDDLGEFSRDRCRTPMQWDTSANAGFSPEGAQTWLPIHDNYSDGINVAAQKGEDGSLLNIYRDLIHLRRKHTALQTGSYEALDTDNNHYFAFKRQSDDETLLVFLNFSTTLQPIAYNVGGAQSVYSTHDNAPSDELQPFEVRILAV